MTRNLATLFYKFCWKAYHSFVNNIPDLSCWTLFLHSLKSNYKHCFFFWRLQWCCDRSRANRMHWGKWEKGAPVKPYFQVFFAYILCYVMPLYYNCATGLGVVCFRFLKTPSITGKVLSFTWNYRPFGSNTFTDLSCHLNLNYSVHC